MAAPGDLDPSFSDDGMVIGGSNDGWMFEEPDFSDLAVQPDGKIVVAGDSGLDRFNSDGTYDDSFVDCSRGAVARGRARFRLTASSSPPGTPATRTSARRRTSSSPAMSPTKPQMPRSRATARRRLDFAAHEDQAKALAVQPDGKIVVAGYSVGLDSSDVPVRRISLSPGTTPTARSTRGSRATGCEPPTSEATTPPTTSLFSQTARSSLPALPRGTSLSPAMSPMGRLDHTFSGDGKLTVRFGRRRTRGLDALVLAGERRRSLRLGGGSGKFALVGLRSGWLAGLRLRT